MDNSRYYNDSLAYDFELFMPKPAAATPTGGNVIKMPETKSHKKAKQITAINEVSVAFSSVIISLLLLIGLCAGIVLRIQVNETNSKINKAKTELGVLDSIETSLSVEYERRVAYSNLELEATALGMKKMDRDQVVYIQLNDTAVAKNANGEIISE